MPAQPAVCVVFQAGRMTNEAVDVAEGGYVSRRLLQLVMPIFPDRRMFRIHDPEVHPDAPGGPLPPVGVLVSATREQLWVGSLQQDIDVRLVLEEWDGQPLLPDAWDEEAKARLYLRGGLSIDMGTAGTAVSGLRLSGGVGNYEVRVYARYREAVVQMYTELFNQHKDPLSDDFQREKRKLEGVERYLVQLWRDSLADRVRVVTGMEHVPASRIRGGGDRRGRGGLFCLLGVGAEGGHGVDRDPDDRQHYERGDRADYLAPGGPEPGGRTRSPEGGQPGRQAGVLRGQSPLYLSEHPLLVHG
jgi:hypothetical protein